MPKICTDVVAKERPLPLHANYDLLYCSTSHFHFHLLPRCSLVLLG